MILEKLWELHVKMDHLTAVVQTLCEKQGLDHLPLRNDYDKRLPILTLEGLNSFDESLRQDGEFKKYLVCFSLILRSGFISKWGGYIFHSLSDYQCQYQNGGLIY